MISRRFGGRSPPSQTHPCPCDDHPQSASSVRVPPTCACARGLVASGSCSHLNVVFRGNMVAVFICTERRGRFGRRVSMVRRVADDNGQWFYVCGGDGTKKGAHSCVQIAQRNVRNGCFEMKVASGIDLCGRWKQTLPSERPIWLSMLGKRSACIEAYE